MNLHASQFQFGDIVRYRHGTVSWQVRQVWPARSTGDTFHARLVSIASGREANNVPTNGLVLVRAA